MFRETELTTICLTSNHVEGIIGRVEENSTLPVKNLVVMDEWNFTEEMTQRAEQAGLKIYKLTDVLA